MWLAQTYQVNALFLCLKRERFFFFLSLRNSGILWPGASIYRLPRLGLVKEGKTFELLIKGYFIYRQEIASCVRKKHVIVQALFES